MEPPYGLLESKTRKYSWTRISRLSKEMLKLSLSDLTDPQCADESRIKTAYRWLGTPAEVRWIYMVFHLEKMEPELPGDKFSKEQTYHAISLLPEVMQQEIAEKFDYDLYNADM